ncbi:MAG: cupin domain-containing protein, partial [Chrysiogenetes bacterium]|nr:cupin domain-containing protein [Chrysiogenetes bacterium]
TPHEHFGMEEFYVIEGELIDHDGQKYTAGDFVSLGPGVRHYSYSPNGALTVAWLTDTNRTLAEGEELSFGPDVLKRARYRAPKAAE